MARIRIASTSGASENTIVFSPAGGHSHNGRNSSLIDSTAYSMYDFSPTFVGTEVNPDRAVRQENNRIAFEDLIKRVVNNSVLAPAGIRLEPGSLNGSLIIANTITANQLAANTITASEISAGTITANELSSNIVLINNRITSQNWDGTISANGTILSNNIGNTGWAITNTHAVFDSTLIRGSIAANSLVTPNLTISNTGAIISTNFNVTAGGNVTATNANISGAITATSGSFTGTITSGYNLTTQFGNNINGAANYSGLRIGNTGWNNAWVQRSDGTIYFNIQNTSGSNRVYMDSTNAEINFGSGAFIVNNSGALTATNANISGAITATSGTFTGTVNASGGTFSGSITANGTISGGTISGGAISGGTITGAIISGGRFDAGGSTTLGHLDNIAAGHYGLDLGGSFTNIFLRRVSDGGVFFRVSNGSQWIKFENGVVQINAAGFSIDGTSATFSGTVTASSGTIGGFTLGATTLSGTSGSQYFGKYATVSMSRNGMIDSYYQDITILTTTHEHVKINAYAGGGNGAINVSGNAGGSNSERWYTSYGVYNPSDIRLKNLIEDDVDALSLINNVQTTKFVFKNDETERQHFGFIAQQMNEYIPYVAIPGGEDPEKQPWGIVQENLIPYLVKSIQQLNERIEVLESQGV